MQILVNTGNLIKNFHEQHGINEQECSVFSQSEQSSGSVISSAGALSSAKECLIVLIQLQVAWNPPNAVNQQNIMENLLGEVAF